MYTIGQTLFYSPMMSYTSQYLILKKISIHSSLISLNLAGVNITNEVQNVSDLIRFTNVGLVGISLCTY